MTDDPLIGRQLANYRLERLIGRGGMASVYYATDIRLNRPAAVKVIDAHFRSKESYANRFIKEARAVAAWRHEHIVQIYYAGDADGLYYFAMEFIDGKTLAQIITEQTEKGQLLPAEDVLRYGRAIASALDYAHSKGVVHRDVKPLNVLVASDGRVVLTDFGLALDTAQGSLGEVFGTALYTAPEQARRSNAAVPQSDLYSLGVMLYEMLTGALPFNDPSPTSVALQHITLPPPPPRQVNPRLSAAVESVLLRSLAKDPAKRYPTGTALMDALEKALQAPSTAAGSQPSAVPPTTAATQPVTPSPSAVPADAGLPGAPERTSSTGRPVSLASRFARRLIWICLAVLLCLGLSMAAVIVGLAINHNIGQNSRQPTRGLSTRSIPIVLPTASRTPTLAPASSRTAVILPSASPTRTSPPRVMPATASPTLRPATATLTPAGEVLPASSTPQATPTSIPPAPTSTLKYTDRRHFKMFYNETGFYLLQLSGVGDLIAGVDFERLDADSQPLNSFSGNRWARYSPSSMTGWCFRVEITGAGSYSRPPDCGGNYMATINLAPGDPGIFWTIGANSSVFRVLWLDEELTRCEIAAGSCEVYLP